MYTPDMDYGGKSHHFPGFICLKGKQLPLLLSTPAATSHPHHFPTPLQLPTSHLLLPIPSRHFPTPPLALPTTYLSISFPNPTTTTFLVLGTRLSFTSHRGAKYEGNTSTTEGRVIVLMTTDLRTQMPVKICGPLRKCELNDLKSLASIKKLHLWHKKMKLK